MKFDHEGMIQHIRDNYPKAEAEVLIDEYIAEADIMDVPLVYKTDGNFGGGGISEPKFTYNWADYTADAQGKASRYGYIAECRRRQIGI